MYLYVFLKRTPWNWSSHPFGTVHLSWIYSIDIKKMFCFFIAAYLHHLLLLHLLNQRGDPPVIGATVDPLTIPIPWRRQEIYVDLHISYFTCRFFAGDLCAYPAQTSAVSALARWHPVRALRKLMDITHQKPHPCLAGLKSWHQHSRSRWQRTGSCDWMWCKVLMHMPLNFQTPRGSEHVSLTNSGWIVQERNKQPRIHSVTYSSMVHGLDG